MSKLYISPDFAAQSGIASYAAVFYREVLQPRGFEHRSFSSLIEFEAFLARLRKLPEIHVEVGVGTHTEQAILWRLLAMGAVVDLTLHDPPYVAFPHYKFSSKRLNQFSKVAQLALPQRVFGGRLVERARRIYVLSRRGCALVQRAYPGARVRHIPLVTIVPPLGVQVDKPSLVYTGFIGPKKGLDYALALHAELRSSLPDLEMRVTGKPVDASTASYLAGLQARYREGVRFTGYLAQAELSALLSAGHLVILPTHNYRTVCPVSANVVYALAGGSVVVTTTANANAEFVDSGVNGEFLSFDQKRDTQRLSQLLDSKAMRRAMIDAARSRIAKHHSPHEVGRLFDRD